MSAHRPNSARGYDCNAPNEYERRTKILNSLDLAPCQVWMAVQLALRNGTRPEERCWSLWNFEATPADTTRIHSVLAENRVSWLPWARLECPELPAWYWGE